jgi:hypothetical protein
MLSKEIQVPPFARSPAKPLREKSKFLNVIVQKARTALHGGVPKSQETKPAFRLSDRGVNE